MMEQLSLFDDRERTAPLASRLRPETLEEYIPCLFKRVLEKMMQILRRSDIYLHRRKIR